MAKHDKQHSINFSTICSHLFDSTDKPTPPQEVIATEITADSVTLQWQPPSDKGGSDITGYIVEKKEANRRAWQEVATVTDLTTIVPKLLEGNKYFFRVSAKNDVGTSEATEIQEAVLAKNPFGE